MVIGIDGNEANVEQKVGVHQYSFELLHALYRINNNSTKSVQIVVYLKSEPSQDLPEENNYWRYKIIHGKGLWTIKQLMPELMGNNRPDVFFSFSHYLPPILRIPAVCVIHDLGYLNSSEQFKKYDFWQLKYWSAISLIVAKSVIAVSKSTAKEIVRHYPFASNKITVVYHGLDSERFNNHFYANVVRQTKKRYGIRKNYILSLGMLKPSKNIEGLIEAFKILLQKKYDYQLVIAGKKGWHYETIFKTVKDYKIEENVIFTDFIPEKDKAALIKGATVLASPSFWEGFGMHVLEAMACGTPVLVSRIASLPEVAGDAGVYVEPKNPDSIANGLKKVLDLSKVEYNKLVKTTIKQAGKFSWDKTAEETLKVLLQAAK